MSQQLCLKWNNHMNNMMDMFKNLLSTEAMVDVTLACDGLSLKAHKIVLSSCSPFFQSLFLENPYKHPIVILKDIKYTELKAIIEFMYHGEVNVAQDQLSTLMKTAETLRVKGLAEVINEKNQSGDESSHWSVSRTDTPPPKRRRCRTRKRSLSDQSDVGDSETKIKQPYSNIEGLNRDPVEQSADESIAPEEKFGIEPRELLEKTLTTDDFIWRFGRSSVQSNMEQQRRPRSVTDHSASLVSVTSTPMSSDELVSNQQPESPPDLTKILREVGNFIKIHQRRGYAVYMKDFGLFTVFHQKLRLSQNPVKYVTSRKPVFQLSHRLASKFRIRWSRQIADTRVPQKLLNPSAIAIKCGIDREKVIFCLNELILFIEKSLSENNSVQVPIYGIGTLKINQNGWKMDFDKEYSKYVDW